MNSKPEKAKLFYWLEGVTAAEVQRNLNDSRVTRWHARRTRRTLVLLQALMITLLAVHTLVISPVKWQSYIEFATLASTIVLYLLLRKSVRLLSDAPDDLLDERQISVRDWAHTRAYRLLAVSMVFYVALYAVFDTQDAGLTDHGSALGPWVSLGLSYLMYAASLPSMVLAWTLPSEIPPPSEPSPTDPTAII
jgi:hypothetical protein